MDELLRRSVAVNPEVAVCFLPLYLYSTEGTTEMQQRTRLLKAAVLMMKHLPLRNAAVINGAVPNLVSSAPRRWRPNSDKSFANSLSI